MSIIDDLLKQGFVISIMNNDKGTCIIASKGTSPKSIHVEVYGDTFKKAIEALNLKVLGY